MEHEFKLTKTNPCGITAFARIQIELREAEVDVVMCGLPEKPQEHIVTMATYPDWVQPALDGLAWVLQKSAGVNRPRYEVTLRKIVGLEVDSNSDGMRCAAECCLWEALHPGSPLPEIQWVEGKWKLMLND